MPNPSTWQGDGAVQCEVTQQLEGALVERKDALFDASSVNGKSHWRQGKEGMLGKNLPRGPILPQIDSDRTGAVVGNSQEELLQRLDVWLVRLEQMFEIQGQRFCERLEDKLSFMDTAPPDKVLKKVLEKQNYPEMESKDIKTSDSASIGLERSEQEATTTRSGGSHMTQDGTYFRGSMSSDLNAQQYNRAVTKSTLKKSNHSHSQVAHLHQLSLRQALQGSLKALVAMKAFDFFFVFLIVTNAIFIGVQVEYLAAEDTTDIPVAFMVVANVYSALFFIELVLRMAAAGCTGFLCDCENVLWNYLDVFVVSISLLEVIDMVISDGSDGSNLKNFSVLRLARAFRVFRILRVVRLMRFFRDLRILVYSIFSTLRSLVWAMSLLLLIMYMFSIVFCQAASEHVVNMKPPISSHPSIRWYWGSVGSSLFTLFKSMAGGVSWQEVVIPLGDISWIYVALFVIYIVFVLFAVMNVVTGVFCENAIESTQHDQEEVIAQQLASSTKHATNLRKLFQDVDADHTGEITIHEFEDYTKDRKVRAYFEALDIKIDDAWSFFKMLDTDGSLSIDVEEFVDGILRLRGPAKSLDIQMLLHHSHKLMGEQERFMRHIEAKLSPMLRYFPPYSAKKSDRREPATPTAQVNEAEGRSSCGRNAVHPAQVH